MNSRQVILKAKTYVTILQSAFILVLITQSMLYAAGGIMTGSGTSGDPYLVTDYADLKAVGTTYALGAVYRLTADINASASATENGGNGFVPIGNGTNAFTDLIVGDQYGAFNMTAIPLFNCSYVNNERFGHIIGKR